MQRRPRCPCHRLDPWDSQEFGGGDLCASPQECSLCSPRLRFYQIVCFILPNIIGFTRRWPKRNKCRDYSGKKSRNPRDFPNSPKSLSLPWIPRISSPGNSWGFPAGIPGDGYCMNPYCLSLFFGHYRILFDWISFLSRMIIFCIDCLLKSPLSLSRSLALAIPKGNKNRMDIFEGKRTE